MAEIERRATPLFYTVMAVVSIVVLWVATADYRDVLQHRLDTMADRQQYDRISEIMVRCANGEAVIFNDVMLGCARIGQKQLLVSR